MRTKLDVKEGPEIFSALTILGSVSRDLLCCGVHNWPGSTRQFSAPVGKLL